MMGGLSSPAGSGAEARPALSLGAGTALPRMFSGVSGGFGLGPSAAVFGGRSTAYDGIS